MRDRCASDEIGYTCTLEVGVPQGVEVRVLSRAQLRFQKITLCAVIFCALLNLWINHTLIHDTISRCHHVLPKDSLLLNYSSLFP